MFVLGLIRFFNHPIQRILESAFAWILVGGTWQHLPHS